jgi:hypothetical protein
MAEAAGQAVARVAGVLTGSPPPSERLVPKPPIRMPTNEDECRALREWAESAPGRAVPATTDQLAKHLSFMASTLPAKPVDDASGRERVAVYAKLLGGYDNAALGYMAIEACKTLNWFPTPKQCLDILKGYAVPDTDRSLALSYCARFTQARFDKWMRLVMVGGASENEIAIVPERWRRIAEERGGLRRLEDGRYEIRRAPKEDACPDQPPLL